MAECSCARCGSDAKWIACRECGGRGLHGHDCGREPCRCLRPADNRPCSTCDGNGGWYSCALTREWCEAHPRSGSEGVPRGEIETGFNEEGDATPLTGRYASRLAAWITNRVAVAWGRRSPAVGGAKR